LAQGGRVSIDFETGLVPSVLPLGVIDTLDIIFSLVDFISGCADVIGLTAVILEVGIMEVIFSWTVLVAGMFSWTVLVAGIFSWSVLVAGIFSWTVLVAGIFAWSVLVAAISGFVVIGTTDDEGSREDDFAISGFWVVEGEGVGVSKSVPKV
jgi:hypothetical protein